MTRFYDIDEANAALPELEGILVTLASQRAELVRIRDEVLARQAAGDPILPASRSGRAGRDRGGPRGPALHPARMQGLVDQMAAGVARIEAMGITLRDIADGLVDFPALVNGRQVWLCWKLGEPAVEHWHTLESGFGGRQPLSELA